MMKRPLNTRISSDTSRLLAELDQAIGHSGAMREIIRRREQLAELERLTGASPRSRELRKEIWLLEQQLRADRIEAGLAPSVGNLPV